MDEDISRSEVKRRFKQVEHLAQELVSLSGKHIKALPCDDRLRDEIRATQTLKGGAAKRQVKYLAKLLRQEGPVAELLEFLEKRKGSQLKENNEFHELERLRDTIITAALAEAEENENESDGSSWPGIATAVRAYPTLDVGAVLSSARGYARSRNPRYQREIFRLLKAAMDRRHFQDLAEGGSENEDGI